MDEETGAQCGLNDEENEMQMVLDEALVDSKTSMYQTRLRDRFSPNNGHKCYTRL